MRALRHGALERIVRLEPGHHGLFRRVAAGELRADVLVMTDGVPGETLCGIMGPVEDEDVRAEFRVRALDGDATLGDHATVLERVNLTVGRGCDHRGDRILGRRLPIGGVAFSLQPRDGMLERLLRIGSEHQTRMCQLLGIRVRACDDHRRAGRGHRPELLRERESMIGSRKKEQLIQRCS